MARVLVVGGGFAGLSAAARLAKLRHDVVLLEAGELLGGRLRGIGLHEALPDDTGGDAPDDSGRWQLDPPTFTLPGVLRDLFRKSGRILDTAMTIETVPGRRHVFAEHLGPHGTRGPTVLDLPMGRRSDQVDAVRAALGADEWTPLLDTFPESWDVVRRRLLHRLPSGPQDLDRTMRRTVGTRRTLARLARKSVDDARVRAMLLDPVRLGGDDPRLTPSALALVHYLERNFGRWEVQGGSPTLADALTARLEQRRVDVRLRTSATDVAVETAGRERHVTGVRTSSGIESADLVVWAAPTWPAAVPAPGLLPRIPASRTLVLLDADPGVPRDVEVHADPPLRLWSEDGLRWTIAHQNAEDPLIALVRVGIDLRSAVVERRDLPPAALVRRHHWGWQWHGWRSAFERPAGGGRLPAGLFMAGAHAHSGGSLEQIGLATEAIAEHLGRA